MAVKKPTIFILLSFVVVAVFGFLCMGLSSHTDKHPCPIYSVSDSNCAFPENGSAHMLHHLLEFKSNVVAIPAVNMVTLVFSLLVLPAFMVFGGRNSTRIRSFKYERSRRLFSPIETELFWSALHNKRGMMVTHGCYH